jgi:hypothetical protein
VQDWLKEGDRILVKNKGGRLDTGVFIRFEGDYLIWIRDSSCSGVISSIHMNGISVSKLN